MLLKYGKVLVLVSDCTLLLTQYCAGDKIEKNEMGGAYGTMEEGRGVHKVLVGENWGKETTGETNS